MTHQTPRWGDPTTPQPPQDLGNYSGPELTAELTRRGWPRPAAPAPRPSLSSYSAEELAQELASRGHPYLAALKQATLKELREEFNERLDALADQVENS